MKLVAKIQKVSMPENMLVDGMIDIDNVEFILNQSTQDITTGFKIELNITITTDVNGFKIEPFQRKISHTLSQQQFNEFMEHLNKQHGL